MAPRKTTTLPSDQLQLQLMCGKPHVELTLRKLLDQKTFLAECRGCEGQVTAFTDMFSTFLSTSIVTIMTTIPKMLSVSCLSDYCPVAFTHTIVKHFKRLIMRYIKTLQLFSLEALEFAYCPNRSTNDT